jgi:hypothetical protein
MDMNTKRSRVRAALVGLLCVLLASCNIVIHQTAPQPPSPMQLATSLRVAFDYSSLMVEGMGSAKSEAEWVAAKTAADPAYPKTWADLKAKWEENFMRGLSSGSPLPVSRAPDAPATASRAVPSRVLLAQVVGTSGGASAGVSAAPAADSPAATDATPPPVDAPAPAPAQPAFDGVLTLRVALASFKLGKYIPMFTTNSQLHVLNTWWASGAMVEDSQDSVEFVPSITTPSVFQHVQAMGNDAGARAAGFLRERHKR